MTFRQLGHAIRSPRWVSVVHPIALQDEHDLLTSHPIREGVPGFELAQLANVVFAERERYAELAG